MLRPGTLVGSGGPPRIGTMALFRVLAYLTFLPAWVSTSGCVATQQASAHSFAPPTPMLATEPADTMRVNPISPDRLEHLEVRGRVFAPIRETSDGIACEFRFWFGNRSGQEL